MTTEDTPRATPSTKQHALAVFQAHGAAEAARQTGFKPNTISQWARRAGIVCADPSPILADARARAHITWTLRRIDEADAVGQAAETLRGSVLKAAEEDKPQMVRACAIAYGIFVDKAQILSQDAPRIPAATPVAPTASLSPSPADVVTSGRERALALVPRNGPPADQASER